VIIDSGSPTGWTHIASTYSDTDDEFKAYINGVQVGTTETSLGTFSGNLASTTTVIGAYNTSSSTPWLGKIDDVKVYDYARNPSQIAYDYNRGAPKNWWKFDECEGTTAYDSGFGEVDGPITITGSGDYTSAGTCDSGTGTEAWNAGSTGKRNYALGLDGTNDYLNVSSPDLPTDDFTYTGWIKPDTVTANDFLLSSVDQSGNQEFGIRLSSDMDIFMVTAQEFDSTALISTGVWTHFALTRVGSNMTLYLNGEQDSTDTNSTTLDFDTCPLIIGGDQDTGCAGSIGDNYDGLIDDFRIYNYGLSANQVKNVYNESAVRFGPETGSP